MTTMRNALRVTVSTFGILAGLAGIEHGIGEIWQGNVAPDGLVIESWAGSEAFRALHGEPAVTMVPNLFISGLLAVVTSLLFLVGVTRFIEQAHGGSIVVLLSLVMLAAGAGFGPPLLGIILGIAATRINAPLDWWRRHLSPGARRYLAMLWPWSYLTGVTVWLLLLPGIPLLALAAGVSAAQSAAAVVTPLAFVTLGTTIVTALARETQRRSGDPRLPTKGNLVPG